MALKKFISIQSALLAPISDTPQLDAELLILSILKKDRHFLYAHPETEITEEEIKTIEGLVSRRLNGEPIAYIVGHQEFWSLDFIVTKDTLIPRADTELLVELALKKIQSPFADVLDLGTGSGAIAISIAKEKPQWKMMGTDFSEAALLVARENARRHHVPVLFQQGSWFQAVPEGATFDVIVSNPPYIPERDPHLEGVGVRYEPRSALASGSDGLNDLRMIIEGAHPYLKPRGALMVEHGYDQAESVFECFKKFGYTGIEQHRDLAGNSRVTYGQHDQMY